MTSAAPATDALYQGPTSVTVELAAGELLLLHNAWDWGNRANMPVPTGGAADWVLVVEDELTSNAPMQKVWAGTAAADGEATITCAASSADSWNHLHFRQFPAGSTVAGSDAAIGSGASVDAPSLGALTGDTLVTSALKSYHGSGTDFTPPPGVAAVETDPVGEYSTYATGSRAVEVDGATGVSSWTAPFALTQWSATSVLVRPGGEDGTDHTADPVEPVGLVDTAGQNVAHVRILVDPLALADEPLTASAASRTVVEVLDVADTAAGASATSRDLADPAGLLDVATGSSDATRDAVDALALADATSTAAAVVIEVVLVDPVSLADVAGATRAVEVVLVDALAAVDVADRLVGSGRVVLDPIAAADTASTTQVQVRVVVDPVSAADMAAVPSPDPVRGRLTVRAAAAVLEVLRAP